MHDITITWIEGLEHSLPQFIFSGLADQVLRVTNLNLKFKGQIFMAVAFNLYR